MRQINQIIGYAYRKEPEIWYDGRRRRFSPQGAGRRPSARSWLGRRHFARRQPWESNLNRKRHFGRCANCMLWDGVYRNCPLSFSMILAICGGKSMVFAVTGSNPGRPQPSILPTTKSPSLSRPYISGLRLLTFKRPVELNFEQFASRTWANPNRADLTLTSPLILIRSHQERIICPVV